MRIVGGRWAGRDLVSPGAGVRPTAEPIRDRWLTLLEPELDAASVLDLFAGTGALGLEAMSRGAKRVDFVENGPAALHSLKANVAFVEALDPGAYDVAFADPPYGSRKLDRVVEQWLRVPFSRILTVEHDRDHHIPGRAKHHDMGGQTRVSIFIAPRRPREQDRA